MRRIVTTWTLAGRTGLAIYSVTMAVVETLRQETVAQGTSRKLLNYSFVII